MINRRYFLVVIDSSGRSVRRFSVARRSLQLGAGALAAVLLLTLTVAVHGLARRHAAAEAEDLTHENAMLRQVASQLENRLPSGRLLGMRAELTFAQLWAKSGLGLEPKTWGIGPLESDPLAGLGGGSSDKALQWPAASHVLSVDAPALPLEFDRLESEGIALQTNLGELLEYFHDAALLLSNTPSLRPVIEGSSITSHFGKRRDPMNGSWVMHKGVDLGGHIGSEIDAPADGVVIFTGLRGGYGQTVVVDHGYGLQTHYAHLSHIWVRPGDHVRRGDHIADVGSTGRSTGPHLHYEVRRLGEPINPERFILD
jgi:murein DD-endopeptidase MepM/ murein hydrolase activator NlpD